jgi:hypothetical protein
MCNSGYKGARLSGIAMSFNFSRDFVFHFGLTYFNEEEVQLLVFCSHQ